MSQYSQDQNACIISHRDVTDRIFTLKLIVSKLLKCFIINSDLSTFICISLPTLSPLLLTTVKIALLITYFADEARGAALGTFGNLYNGFDKKHPWGTHVLQ